MSNTRLLRFSDLPGGSLESSERSTYQLLALPPSLLSRLTSSASSSNTTQLLQIRGDSNDNAALVTESETYQLRGVQNSNSLCVCAVGGEERGGIWFDRGDNDVNERPRKRTRIEEEEEGDAVEGGGGEIEIEAVLHETLEAVVGVAKTEKLASMLKGTEYEGEIAQVETPPSKRLTFDTLRNRLPASDGEIRKALSKHRVVNLDESLQLVPPSFLLRILPSILSTLPLPAVLAHPTVVSKSKKSKATLKGKDTVKTNRLDAEAEEQDLVDALDAADCGRIVALEIIKWFSSEIEGRAGRWKFDVSAVVREVGIVLLADGGFGQQAVDPFVAKWKELCGGFAPVCEIPLLSGTHLYRPLPLNTIQYLPCSSLSSDPATRFSELFSLKPRWLEQEMGLFIDDLTGGDKKKRDALVLKFVRKVKERDEVFWTPRNLWT